MCEFAAGFQTLFGLVLDTSKGTFVLDDDLDSENLVFRMISEGENAKVRHFYRAKFYSHVLANIKESFVEMYGDLSDYFFPKEKKNIRLKRF